MMHKDFCIVSDRPEFIHQDEQNRPHSDTGPFCRWRDGWSLYYVHGVKVTRQIVEAPETLTIEQIRGEENAEVRRVMLDRFGWDRYLQGSDAELVDEVHEPPFPGLLDAKLWRCEIPGDEDLCMLDVLNSTVEADGERHRFMIRVPPDMVSAHAAAAWTFGMDADEYLPLVES